MTLYNLAEVKGEIRKFSSVTEIIITVEEFGEGFDTHINVWYLDKYLNREFESFQLGEEEKKGYALRRAKSAFNSLSKLYDDKVQFEGIVNC